MNKPKLLFASALAASITVSFVVMITIWAELAAPLKDWLKNLSGHHWTSKSLLSALIYSLTLISLYLLPLKTSDQWLQTSLRFLLWLTVAGILILVLFFTGHYFSK